MQFFLCSLIRPPGTLVPGGLMFYPWRFFLSPRDLRAPSADRRETLSHDRNLGEFYNAIQKFRKPSSPKKLGAKNMQNSARFQTTSDFDREYLRNGTRYPKSERNIFTGDSSRVRQIKPGELWSTNYREPDVSLDPPKLHFRETMFRPSGGAGPSNFNTHYRLTKAWYRTSQRGRGSPQKI